MRYQSQQTEETMKLIDTTISEATVEMRFADHADPSSATEWIDFEVRVAALKHPNDPSYELGDIDLQMVAEVRLAALHYVRDVIAAEIQRLAKLGPRKHE